MKLCSGCRLAHYCDRACQMTDWKSFHKYGECEWYQTVQQLPDSHWFFTEESVIYRLTMRLHFLLKGKPELMDHKFTTIDGRLMSFADVPDDVYPEHVAEHQRLVSTLLSNLILTSRGSHSQADAPHFSSLMAKIRRCLSATPRLSGVAVYVPVSIMKLSCKPNTAYVKTTGHQMQVRAVRDIAVSEAVTHCFFEVIILMPKAQRMENMRFFKLMTCDCDRCRAGDQENEATELLEVNGMGQGIMPFVLSGRREPPDSLVNQMLKNLFIVKKYAGAGHSLTERVRFAAARMISMTSYEKKRNYQQQYDRIMSEK